jgi:hypothetical protein
MSSITAKIRELIEEGRYTEQPRPIYRARVNWFDAIDGLPIASVDPSTTGTPKPKPPRVKEEGLQS